MPLSDRERSVLSAVEASLHATDPDLVRTLALHSSVDDPTVALHLITQPIPMFEGDTEHTLVLDQMDPLALEQPEQADEETLPLLPMRPLLILDRDAAYAGALLSLLGLVVLVGGMLAHPSISVVGFGILLAGATRLAQARRDDLSPEQQ